MKSRRWSIVSWAGRCGKEAVSEVLPCQEYMKNEKKGLWKLVVFLVVNKQLRERFFEISVSILGTVWRPRPDKKR